MTAQVLFDTARFRDRLTASGMPDQQARALTEGFEEALRDATATKLDLDRQSETLGGKIEGAERRLETKIVAVETSVALLDEAVGRRIAEALSTQSRWMIASLFGGLGLLFAALKLFP